MADPTMVTVDPPLPAAGFDSELPIPSFDADLFSAYLVGDDGGSVEDQNNLVSLDDLDLDFDLDDLCIPTSDELDDILNPIQLQRFGHDPLFAPEDQLSDHAVFQSTSPEKRHLSGDGDPSGPISLDGSGVSSYASSVRGFNQFSNEPSCGANGWNSGSSEQSGGDAKGLNRSSPVSQGSENYRSYVSDNSNYCANKAVSSSPNLNNNPIKVVDFDQNNRIENSTKINNVNSSLLKRKKGIEDLTMNNNVGSRSIKYMKSNCITENNDSNSHEEIGLSEEEKRKARLIRNRESAQLSRQRKKQYVEVLEDKVKAMDSMIQDLNVKISYIVAENATLRQRMGCGGAVLPLPMATLPHGMYPNLAMMHPWMPHMVMPQGSHVPRVPIPRLKRQQPAQAPKVNKKVESKNNGRQKTKKVAGVSFLGLLFFIMLFGSLVPMVNVRYGGVREAFFGYVGDGFNEKHHGRVLMLNGTECGEKYGDMREFVDKSNVQCGRNGHHIRREPNVDEFVTLGNGSEPLAASLYVPKNNKLVKIVGNLVIHSVLASEKAMAPNGKEGSETGLAVRGDLSPAIQVGGVARHVGRHPQLMALGSGSKDSLNSVETDGTVQQWFHEGLTGPLLTSGMCTKVFEFDASSAIAPAPASRNISENQSRDSTHPSKSMNRRILRGLPIPLPESSRNLSANSAERNSRKENLNGNHNSSSMVVSVLVDPREAGDASLDGVTGTKSISRIFVVVLIDSVKYITYSCRLPFMGSAASHL